MPVPVPRSKVSPPKSPQSDPKFQRVAGRVQSGATRLKQHPSPRIKAAQAQAAAVPPARERLAGAQAKQVDKMQQAKPKPVEPNGFLIALRAEIEKVMPQNLDEADKFMEGGEQQQMKSAVTGKVNAQKDAATGDVKSSARQAPDAGSVPGKQVTPIPGEPAPPTPRINAGEGMPSPKPEVEVTQKNYKENADQQLKDAEVTPTQLKKANDPRFSAVLTAKTQVDKLADAGPAKYRVAEKGTLTQAVVRATGDARQGAAALVGIKNRSGTAVRAQQNAAKARDEKRRKEVTETIEGIYGSTKASVEAKLNGLEAQVLSQFDAGASAAIGAMKANSKREIEAFKDERYSGVRGKARWVADLFRPVPQGIKDILARNRQRFTQEMDRLIVSIATLVDARLREAKGEIDKGQAKIKAYVASLPRDLQAVGRAAEQEVGGRFDELRRSVDDKKNDLAQKLAQKYKEASDKADAELKKIEEENAGALRGLIDKLAEIVKILSEFKDKLLSLLRKGMATIKLIIADPIGFLGNLISAIKQGIQQFKTNFFKHLQDAFIKWLFGAMAGAGVQLPASLSLPEILKFVLSVLGITYDRMRQKAVKLLGPTAVAIIEKVVEYVKALVQGGPAALWEKVKEDLGNLKAMVIDAIITWVTETIVKQAVAKIVSMFNPAGAIVQAIIAIYNVVMFVVERASQIMAFVEAVINSVHSIATGAIGGAANWIEKSLAGALVLVISFLARLIGLGGISQKIKEFIQKVQNVVDRAIDKAIGKVVDVVKKLFGRFTGKDGKPDERSDAQKRADLNSAVREANAALAEEGRRTAAQRRLVQIKQRYRLSRADIVVDERKKGTTVFHAELEINPISKSTQVGEMDSIDPPISVTPSFFCKRSLDKAEFKRQIDLQESTINAMDVHTWLANRRRFEREGRSAEGTKLQQQLLDSEFAAFRARVIAERSAVYRTQHGMTAPEALAKAEAFANRLLAYTTVGTGRRRFKNTRMTDSAYDGKTVDNELYKKVALHALDQVAGGSGTDVVGLGGAREDYSLGALWMGLRVDNLEKAVNREVRGKKAAELKNIRMNVKLPVIYE